MHKVKSLVGRSFRNANHLTTYSEFKRGTVAGQVGEEVDGGINDGRVENVGEQLVVPLRDTLAEVVLGHRPILSRRACVSRTRAARTTPTAKRRAFHLVTHRGSEPA